MKKAKIGITIDNSTLKAVDAIATTKGAPRSVIIQVAIKQFIERYEQQQQRLLENAK